MLKLICKCCNEIFDAPREGRKYCSKECQYKSVSDKLKGNKNQHGESEIRTFKCLQCNKEITTRSKGKKFCNQDCRSIYRKTQLKDIECETCCKIFKPKRKEQRFCSIRCSKPRKNEYHFYTCKGCNKILESRYKETKICDFCKETKYRDKYLANFRGTWCLYKDIKVMSTYELRACNIFDKLKEEKKIYDWEYTTDRIPYIGMDNEWHEYLLDFKIYETKNDCYYIETKGLMDENDILKWQATRNKGFRLDVWYIEEIKEMEEKLEFTKDDIDYLLNNCIIRK